MALAAQQLRLEMAIAAEEATLADWQARRAAGQRVTRAARPGTGKKARKARARLEALQAGAAAEAGQPADAGNEKKGAKAPQRNVTDPDSRLMPVRGGGFIQGYNCQDAASDDRLMLGGYACQDTGDVLQAQELARVAARAPRSSRPATPPTAPTPPCSQNATTGCAPCRRRTGTIPATASPPAMPP